MTGGYTETGESAPVDARPPHLPSRIIAMSNLLASLVSSAGTLEAYGRVLETAQNNVANASTPGYAKQRLELYALPFDPAGRGHRRRGRRQAGHPRATSSPNRPCGSKPAAWDISSSWSTASRHSNPTSISRAIRGFRRPSTTCCRASPPGAPPPTIRPPGKPSCSVPPILPKPFSRPPIPSPPGHATREQQIGQTVDQVNQLVGELQGYNHIAMQGNKNDGGLSARMHAALEELSSLADVHATFQSDGTVSLMLNGQTPLLLEDKQFSLSSSLYQPQNPPPTNAAGPASVRIQASDGSDITSKTTGAQLGALLHLRNQILPSLIGDAYQAGDLNVMAKQFADRVNQLLTSGNITDGPPAQPGVPLFTYDTTDATATAASLSVDPAVTPDQLAAITPGPPRCPTVFRSRCLALASPVQDADQDQRPQLQPVLWPDRRRVGSRSERRHKQPGRAAIPAFASQGPAPAIPGRIARRRSHHPHAVPARLSGQCPSS